MDGNPDFILLMHKSLTGKITPEELALLEAWRQERIENQALCEQIRQAWELSERYGKDTLYDGEHELHKLMKRIDSDGVEIPGRRSVVSTSRIVATLKYAASLLLLASALYFGYRYLGHTGDQQSTVATITGVRWAVLPDSSTVQLNRNSTIEYRYDRNERHIQLTGEAFFDVMPDPQRPFLVSTEYAAIKVVGTSFNVRADSEEEQVTIVVTSGVVEVTSASGQELVSPGNRCVVHKESGLIESSMNSDPNFFSWHTGKFTYEKVPLETVFRDMERYYAIKIETENKELLGCRFTGSFDNLALEDAMKVISFAFTIKMEKVDSTLVTVRGKHCF